MKVGAEGRSKSVLRIGYPPGFMPSRIFVVLKDFIILNDIVVYHTMEHLETVILSFDNWSLPWIFHDFVYNSLSLNQKDKEAFQTIWSTALNKDNWLQHDLATGCKTAQNRLNSAFNLRSDVILIIVRAASYQWK